MTPELRDRLVRLETMLETFIAEARRTREEQREHNEIFFATTTAVANMKSQAKGVWVTVGTFGALTVAVSSGVAWVVAFLTGRGH